MRAATIKRLLREDTNYQKFFKSAMRDVGIDSPSDLTDAGKRAFFNWIESHWDEDDGEKTAKDGQKVTDVVKADHIKESALRRIVREEHEVIMEQRISPSAQLIQTLSQMVVTSADLAAAQGKDPLHTAAAKLSVLVRQGLKRGMREAGLRGSVENIITRL